MGPFGKLKVWQRGRDPALAIYRATARFPGTERYGLAVQMRSAAVSIPSNIAEGCGRRSDRELSRFLRIALGSATELECQVILACELSILDAGVAQELLGPVAEVQGMLAKLLRKLSTQAAHSP
ncbi:MAG TPA: four helix bundle protein [Gemmatimonadales bacterium]|nr:four helix bundle protein [Gemmatimonadales bacterium]